ncbi:Elongin-A [Grifola frondosa]|uniref:Elongin-A n=1 Tax=Grifola frondosa TaxID=5627 RepID=A0A1C7MH18_GRIFR|nr:Elongin-A [Grifola frondosa]
MYHDNDLAVRKIPSLVQYCQRVASSHVEGICSLGDGLRFDIIRPILENCSAETLQRLEQASPYIEKDTSDMWKGLCFRSYPLAAQQYESNAIGEPDSWRDQYFVFSAMEAKRLDEVAARLRVQRQEAEERKKESQIKITDRPPPAKRSRWGTSAQPKTLLQKTRSEAARVQKGIYAIHSNPTIPNGKNYRILPSKHSAKLLPPPPASSSSSSGPRVTVTTVTVRRPKLTSPKAVSSTSPSRIAAPSCPAFSSIPRYSQSVPRHTTTSTAQPISPPKPVSISEPRLASQRPSQHSKKDPMASLFMPKHRAHSQLPTQPLSSPVMRSRP